MFKIVYTHINPWSFKIKQFEKVIILDRFSQTIIYSMFRFYVHYKNNIAKNVDPCADPESFVRGGPTLTTFFYEKK